MKQYFEEIFLILGGDIHVDRVHGVGSRYGISKPDQKPFTYTRRIIKKNDFSLQIPHLFVF